MSRNKTNGRHERAAVDVAESVTPSSGWSVKTSLFGNRVSPLGLLLMAYAAIATVGVVIMLPLVFAIPSIMLMYTMSMAVCLAVWMYPIWSKNQVKRRTANEQLEYEALESLEPVLESVYAHIRPRQPYQIWRNKFIEHIQDSSAHSDYATTVWQSFANEPPHMLVMSFDEADRMCAELGSEFRNRLDDTSGT